jgi:dihydrofolate reductase/thymidylate synthase
VLNNSVERKSRNSVVKSTFFKNMTFDIRNGFPLLTTKKMFFRGIVEELLFFIRGQTDSNILESKGVNIWKGNTSREFLDSLNLRGRKEGIMGPLYGYQWRYFNSKYDETTGKPLEKGIDQFQNVIDCIKNNPESRRILMTDFNPEQANEGVLYPCHSIILQFYVDGDMLDMSCYYRSQDLFLGVPFNIASSALLLCIVSKICNKTPRYLHICMGDVHIYEHHYEQVKIQCDRQAYVFPTLKIKNISSIEEAENLTYKDFILENYRSHPIIKAEMIA